MDICACREPKTKTNKDGGVYCELCGKWYLPQEPKPDFPWPTGQQSEIDKLYEQIRRCAYEAEQLRGKVIGDQKSRYGVAALLLYHAAQALKDPKLK